jgi:hypothetical protein
MLCLQYQLWYSIDAGLIHFVCLSTEVLFHDKDNIDRQNRWLEEDLKKVNENRNKNPWIVALGHRPLYCSVDDKNEDCRKTIVHDLPVLSCTEL